METGLLFVVPLALICKFVDSSLGMGYGTILTPILLLMGFSPLQIVPSILFSEFITGLTAAFFHHSLKNVNFERHSQDIRVAAVLSCFAVAGTVAAVFLTVKLPANILTTVIGFIILAMGVVILVKPNRTPRFTWRKIVIIGTIASFNKGMSGGGYGPLVMGGQLFSGIAVRNAVGITLLSKGVTCFVGVISYCILRPHIDWSLAPSLLIGAVLSVPLGAYFLKRMSEKTGKITACITMAVLGCLTLGKVVSGL